MLCPLSFVFCLFWVCLKNWSSCYSATKKFTDWFGLGGLFGVVMGVCAGYVWQYRQN